MKMTMHNSSATLTLTLIVIHTTNSNHHLNPNLNSLIALLMDFICIFYVAVFAFYSDFTSSIELTTVINHFGVQTSYKADTIIVACKFSCVQSKVHLYAATRCFICINSLSITSLTCVDNIDYLFIFDIGLK